MRASFNGYTELVRLLLEQEEIDINAKNINLLYLIFIVMFLDFKILFKISLSNSK